MKKLQFLMLLFVMNIPFVVMAEDNTCEQINTYNEKTIDIHITQKINNQESISDKDINSFKFNYKILDLNDNILAETTNDESGNITFHCFDVKSSDIGSYKLYKIIMEDNENIPFDYDPYTIYFSLRPNYTNGLFDPKIAFYKDDGDDSPEKYDPKYKGKVFHATEEELEGQAYAVLDRSTGVMTFFRDEAGKYTNKQDDGNKIYYTGFEEHQNKSCFSAWWGGWRYDYDIMPYIKKIVFKDAVRPNNITGWFEYLTELEEVDLAKLDTSQLTGIDYFLHNCPKLKNVDISTFDVSNVNSIFKSFYNTGIEYLDFSVWNLNSNLERVQMGEFVQSNSKLKYLNISNFGNWSSSAEFHDLPCLEKMVINDTYDFYRAGSFARSSPDVLYNVEKNKYYTFTQIRNNLYYKTEPMAGYYIRPMCTTEASFVSNYKPSKIKRSVSVIKVKETKEWNVEVEDIQNVEYNATVKFRIKPIEEYELTSIEVLDSFNNVIDYKKTDKDDEYEFIMPDTDVIIKPIYQKIQLIDNPNTGDKLILLFLLMIVSLIIGIIANKKKVSRY